MEQYFAAKDTLELAADLTNKMEGWRDGLSTRGYYNLWFKSYQMYYGRHWKLSNSGFGSTIQKLGDQGEFNAVTVNDYRNLIKHILVLTTNQRPAFDVRAINTDLDSLRQSRLASNILDAYLKEKRLRRYVRGAAEQALVFGKGFTMMLWEPSLGKPFTAEKYEDQEGNQRQRLVYEGDIDTWNPSVLDVFNDQTQEDWNKCQWVCVRVFKNKFDLAIRYPDQAEKILQLKTKSEMDGNKLQYLTWQSVDETADVPVYYFFHLRSDSLVNGRFMMFCDEETVLYDGAMPYSKLPIFRITPGEVFGTTEGYTEAFDLMGLQEAQNVIWSTIFTNQSTFGVQSVLIPDGCNLTAHQISKGLVGLRYNPAAGEPKPFNMTYTPAELFKFVELLEKKLEVLSGVNQVARGNPEAFLRSGVALGLLQSMAIQYASGFQESYAELLEDIGSHMLDLLKNFAKTNRLVAMAGKWNRGAMQSFTGSDLSNISRVVVELGNPLARTFAGRAQIADNLLERGLIKSPQEYVTVLQTGNIDPMLQSDTAELDLVRKEGEDLLDGKVPQAMVFDSHLMHMKEHKALLADPFVRQNSQLLQGVLEHISQHQQLYNNASPLMNMVSGEPPSPESPMMMAPPPGMPGPGGPGPGPHPGPGPGGPPPGAMGMSKGKPAPGPSQVMAPQESNNPKLPMPQPLGKSGS